MNYALIGCGRIAVNHLQAALDNHFTISAVCDMSPEAMEALLTRFGLQDDKSIARYTDYQLMFAEHPEIRLASIATGSSVHARLALGCIDAGVNVIVEKPIALTMADADEIVRRSEEKGVKVSACQQNRFNLAVQEMRKALEAGRFGKLSHGAVSVRWNRDRAYYEQAGWRGTWASDGGCLMNQCLHGVDLLRWMMGDEIEEVYGSITQRFHDYLQCEDAGFAVVKFKNGAVGTIEGTVNVYPENLEETLYLFGETGTAKLGGTSANDVDVWRFADETEADASVRGLREQTENVYGNGHAPLFADMADAIEHDRKPYVDAVAGRNAVELVLAIYQSAATGKSVKLPLGDVKSADFEGFFAK